MKKFRHQGKRYKFVNERTVDGVKYRLFRRTRRRVELVTETILVIGHGPGKKITVVKDAKQAWRKIRRKKKRVKNVNRL